MFGSSNKVPSISAEELDTLRQRGSVVLDVRERGEYHAGHIPGSIHIPLSELQHRVNELPNSKDLLVCCKSGGRSTSATEILKSLNFNVKNLAGGLSAWVHSGRKLSTPEGSSGYLA